MKCGIKSKRWSNSTATRSRWRKSIRTICFQKSSRLSLTFVTAELTILTWNFSVWVFIINLKCLTQQIFLKHAIFFRSKGHSFVGFFSNYGFEKMLRVAGRSFRHFLHSIDQLHDSNRYSFPKMKSPLFFVGGEDLHGCFLHYQ